MPKELLTRFKIPLLNGGRPSFNYQKEAIRVGSQAIRKPDRRLGAGYIADKLSRDTGIILCDNCIRKYYGFWEKTDHRPNWGYYFTGHCDGCGTRYALCILFLPDKNFRKVLAEQHGQCASPRRKLFRLPWR